MQHAILDEDWSDYENRKSENGRDISQIFCWEPWEIIYLVEKLKKYYPLVKDFSIQSAILTCCKEIQTPMHRGEFLKQVMNKLPT